MRRLAQAVGAEYPVSFLHPSLSPCGEPGDLAVNPQLTGLAATYMAAAKLVLDGYNAVVTSRNMQGTDLYAENPRTGRSVALQVKANRKTFSYFLVGKAPLSVDRYYVFVNIRPQGTEYYIVPGSVAKRKVRRQVTKRGTWRYISRASLEEHKEAWPRLWRVLGPAD